MKKTLTSVRVFLGPYDLTGRANVVAPSYTREWPECTTFADTAVNREPGVLDLKAGISGFWDSSMDVDDALLKRIGLAGVPFMHTSDSNAQYATAYFFNAGAAEYTPDFTHGEVLKFSSSVHGDSGDPLIAGRLLETGVTARTATGTTGTAQQLGAVPSGGRVWAAIHVVEMLGTAPSVTFTVKSAAAVGFSTPTTHITSSAFTAAGSALLSAVGPVTNTWWRVDYTISGTTPQCKFAIAVGVL